MCTNMYKVDGCLESIDQCVAKADDIIIFGYDVDGRDHDKTVRKVMIKAKEVGMCFNPNKCQFKKTQVKFFGILLNRQGVVPNPSKINALKNLPKPRTEPLLQSFLGMVNYLGRFDPKLADLTHNLRGLLKKTNEFLWNETHSKDFKLIIQTLCANPKLPKVL